MKALKEQNTQPGLVKQTSNPSYSGGWRKRIMNPRPTWDPDFNSRMILCLKIHSLGCKSVVEDLTVTSKVLDSVSSTACRQGGRGERRQGTEGRMKSGGRKEGKRRVRKHRDFTTEGSQYWQEVTLLSRDQLEYIQTWNDLGNKWPWEVELWKCLEGRSCKQILQ